jgi:hypothetical protein
MRTVTLQHLLLLTQPRLLLLQHQQLSTLLLLAVAVAALDIPPLLEAAALVDLELPAVSL